MASATTVPVEQGDYLRKLLDDASSLSPRGHNLSCREYARFDQRPGARSRRMTWSTSFASFASREETETSA